MENAYPFPPGHPQAVADGCTCPATLNANGNGIGYVDADGYPLYMFDLDCPLHKEAMEMRPDELCFEQA